MIESFLKLNSVVSLSRGDKMSEKRLATLEKIVEAVEPLDDRKFIPAKESFVYLEPLKVREAIPGFSSELNEVTNLNHLEQVFLLSKLSKKFGIKLRLPSLEESYLAWRNESFRNNVLNGRDIYTRIIVRKENEKVEVREVDEAFSLPKISLDKILTVPQVRSPLVYVAPKIVGNEIALKPGFFYEFKVVPKESDILKKVPRYSRGGFWVGAEFDENNYSVIGCKSSGGTFAAYAIGPLRILPNRVVAISTPEEPRK